jgi:hypothetical protein
MRSNVSAIGAKSPSVAYPGKIPIRKVGIAIAVTENQRAAAAEPVADMADQRSPDRAHHEADRKHPERREQL